MSKLYYYNPIFDLLNDITTYDTTTVSDPASAGWTHSRVEDNKLEFAISVIGHDPKNVEVELLEDSITVKAKKSKDSKSISNSLTKDIHEHYKLRKDFDGLSAKATIEHGILVITVEKKESSKPKKLDIKF
jgi:HSP20 family molecular chaperone IbpA